MFKKCKIFNRSLTIGNKNLRLWSCTIHFLSIFPYLIFLFQSLDIIIKNDIALQKLRVTRCDGRVSSSQSLWNKKTLLLSWELYLILVKVWRKGGFRRWILNVINSVLREEIASDRINFLNEVFEIILKCYDSTRNGNVYL